MKTIFASALPFVALSLLIGCSTFTGGRNTTSTTTPAAATSVADRDDDVSGATEYTLVTFDRGSAALTAQTRAALNRLTQMTAGGNREIDEIKVLAWADQEYPMTGEAKADRNSIHLARDRADVVESYLSEELRMNADIDTHNMARRPGFFSEMMQTEDFKIKNNFQSRTPASASEAPLADMQLAGSKVSKALILIKYE